jgi:NAD(P)-dependent dehydrogenase (short-subunit alcohol dehydrogenase family)
MDKRIALITGGMGGLGESISTKMHDGGFRVVVTHSPGNKNAAQWVADHKGKGYEFAAYGVDVVDYGSCRPRLVWMTLLNALSLCSDEAAFVTGANIAINGGQHMQ